MDPEDDPQHDPAPGSAGTTTRTPGVEPGDAATTAATVPPSTTPPGATAHDVAAPHGPGMATERPPGDPDPPVGPDSPANPPPVARVDRPRRRRWPRRVAWVLGTVVAVLALIIGAWALDSALAGDSVPRNTQLAGQPVGGMAPGELEEVVEVLADELPGTAVVIAVRRLLTQSLTSDFGAARRKAHA